MVYEILSRTTYGRKKKAEVGVERLVEDNLLTAAFPLHSVSIDESSVIALVLLMVNYKLKSFRGKKMVL